MNHFLTRFNKLKGTAVLGVEAGAMARLRAYAWPGNVRELENVIERIVTLKRTGRVSESDLPPKLLDEPLRQAEAGLAGGRQAGLGPSPGVPPSGISLVDELERYETHLIQEALKRADGVTSRAARLLNLNRTTLVEKLKWKGLLRLQSEAPPT